MFLAVIALHFITGERHSRVIKPHVFIVVGVRQIITLWLLPDFSHLIQSQPSLQYAVVNIYF